MTKDETTIKERLASIERKGVFPLKKGGMYDYYQAKNEITTFEHPKFGTIETTRFALECNFEYFGKKILDGLEKIRDEADGAQLYVQVDFTPIKQSRDDDEGRTCTVATATNIVRALLPELAVEEQDLLKDIDPEHFGKDGGLSLSVSLGVLRKNYPVSEYEMDERDPHALKTALDQGCVVQVTWERHTRLISGYFTNSQGEVFVIINDPLPDRPQEYAVNLEELYTVHLSFDDLSLIAFRKRDVGSGVDS